MLVLCEVQAAPVASIPLEQEQLGVQHCTTKGMEQKKGKLCQQRLFELKVKKKKINKRTSAPSFAQSVHWVLTGFAGRAELEHVTTLSVPPPVFFIPHLPQFESNEHVPSNMDSPG